LITWFIINLKGFSLMSTDIAPDELDTTSTATTLADADESTIDESTDESSADESVASSEMWIPTYIKDVIDALDFSGIPEFGSIMVKEIDSWSPEVRAAVIAWCRQPVDDTPDLAMPDVLQQYFPAEEEEEEPVAECDAAPISSMPSTSIPSTALVPVDAIAPDSAPADSFLPSTLVDVVTEAEFIERLESGRATDEDVARLRALEEWHQAVTKASTKADAAEAEFTRLDKLAKKAKKHFEGLDAKLRSIIRSKPDENGLPLSGEQGAEDATNVDEHGDEQGAEPLTQAEPASPSPHARSSGEPAVTMSQEKLDAAADERSWRAWPLESLTSIGLQPRALKAMAGAGLETVGQLSDWQNKHGDFWIKEIKGMGKKVGDNVADAMERFWRERPDRKAKAQSGAA